MLGRICIINAPTLFKAVWQLIKPMLNPRTLNKIQVRPQRCVCWYASPAPSCTALFFAAIACNNKVKQTCRRRAPQRIRCGTLTPPRITACHIPHPQICQTNYAADLLEWVDADNLPVWLGGRSKVRWLPPLHA